MVISLRQKQLAIKDFYRSVEGHGQHAAMAFLKAVLSGKMEAPDLIDFCRTTNLPLVKIAVITRPNSIRAKDADGGSALHVLAKITSREARDVAEYLLDNTDISVFAANNEGKDPLAVARAASNWPLLMLFEKHQRYAIYKRSLEPA